MNSSANLSSPITLALTGDVMLGRLVNEAIRRFGFDHPWGDMLPVLLRADLRLINLECALTDRTERYEGDPRKPFFFKSDTRNVETLERANIDFACLANNHIGDFRREGLLDTVSTLDAAGIAHAGAGSDIEPARRPARLMAKDYRIAVVAFADHPPEWAATPTCPGLNYCRPESNQDEDFEPVESAITLARSNADLVIFTIHWGPNMRAEPPEAFRGFAHRVIDAGADIFWGHSAHVVQGIELYRDKPILYDTGDFVDDYAVHPELRNDRSALFLIQCQPPNIGPVELVPIQIDTMQVNQAHGDTFGWIIDRINRRSSSMNTRVIADNGHLIVA